MDRRTFLKYIASVPLASALPRIAFAEKSDKSTVVIARDDSFKPNAIQRDAARQALRRAVANLTTKEDPEAAWASLFTPEDIVGVKLSCLPGRQLSPQPELAFALADELHQFARIPYKSIILWDRSDRDLRRAGYKPADATDSSPRIAGTNSAGGYDSDVTPWGPPEQNSGSRFSTIISSHATAIVSVGVLKDHNLAGVSIHMKNFYGAINNPSKYHDNNCDPFIAQLNTHPFIKNKLRLSITDAAVGLYNGGPSMKPQWSWNYGGLIIGTDVVAVDAVCADIIERRRAEESMRPLKDVGRPPKYIQTAAALGLGIADLEKINIVEL